MKECRLQTSPVGGISFFSDIQTWENVHTCLSDSQLATLYMKGCRVHNVVGCLRLMICVFSFLAAEISTWLDHPRPAADATQPEELSGAWPAGAMVRVRHSNISSEVTEARKMMYECDI